MEIKITNLAQVPIYEQIENQIKEMILSGIYSPGTQLPSIRVLARDLKVGIITCRRAYDDLCEQGILVSQPGKGVFVAEVQKEYVKDVNREIIFKQLSTLCQMAHASGISKTEMNQKVCDIYDGLNEVDKVDKKMK